MLRTNRMNESGFRDESDEEGRVETSGSSFCSCTGTFPRRGGSSASRGGGSNAAWSYLPGTTITHGLCHSAFRSGSNSSYPGGLILPSEPEIILPPGKQSLCLPKQDRNSFAYLPKLIFRLQMMSFPISAMRCIISSSARAASCFWQPVSLMICRTSIIAADGRSGHYTQPVFATISVTL